MFTDALIGADASVTAWVIAATIMVVIVAAASIRVAHQHERLVVTRLGRVVRVGGPGLVFAIPALEHFTPVSLRPVELEFVVSAATRDETVVRLQTTLRYRVTDPARSVVATPDAGSATAMLVERRLSHHVTQRDLATLLRSKTQFELDLPLEASTMTAAWGIQVIELEVNDIETRLTADLLHSLRREPSARTGHA